MEQSVVSSKTVKTAPVEKGVLKIKTDTVEEPIMATTATIKPPSFVSNVRSYAEYKADLKMWSRITNVKKEIQAELVVYRLEGHPSRIKEKILAKLGTELKNNPNGIDAVIKFLDTINNKDVMTDTWEKYCEFTDFKRKANTTIDEFIGDWSFSQQKAQAAGCTFSDGFLYLKILKDAEVTPLEASMILSGIDYEEGKKNTSLLCGEMTVLRGGQQTSCGETTVLRGQQTGIQQEDSRSHSSSGGNLQSLRRV